MKRKVKEYRGFTLLEVLIATVLVGIAISALMAASGSFTTINSTGIDMSTAEFLMEQVRERAALMTFASLSSLADTYSPPRDSAGNSLNEFSAFSQVVEVDHVTAGNFQTVDASGTSPFIRVQVQILYNGDSVTEASWIHADHVIP